MLREIALLFLKLGTIGFGGPAAHVAMMEDEVVRRRGWLTREAFLDLVGATNLIPGPNSTEMAMHIGRARAGLAGLLVAGACFIVPATAMVAWIAAAYVRYGELPAGLGLLAGVKPVVLAIVLQALWRLGRLAVKTRWLAAVGTVAAAASFLGASELLVLFAAAGVMAAGRSAGGDGRAGSPALCIAAIAAPAAVGGGAAATTAGAVALGPLFLVFVKIGSVLFGSGYVLLAFLRADLVQRLHWLSDAQVLDAIAVGQVTPGPIFTTATFVGYLLAGPTGALAATVGIFLPAFVFVAASAPLIERLRGSPLVGAALDGLNVASLALMAVVTAHIARAAVSDVQSGAVALVALTLLARFGVNATWLILGGAVVGWLGSS